MCLQVTVSITSTFDLNYYFQSLPASDGFYVSKELSLYRGKHRGWLSLTPLLYHRRSGAEPKQGNEASIRDCLHGLARVALKNITKVDLYTNEGKIRGPIFNKAFLNNSKVVVYTNIYMHAHMKTRCLS